MIFIKLISSLVFLVLSLIFVFRLRRLLQIQKKQLQLLAAVAQKDHPPP